MEPRRSSSTWVFKDREYFMSSCVTEDWLEVVVEEAASSNTWRGKFEAKHIEELTRKTGNYKQFIVFATMLETAISKSSESVTLDLLTYSDLETLREKKNASGRVNIEGGGGGRERAGRPAESSPGKRYLILTYSVEFDRIHYPLALSYAGQADSGQLRNTVRRLTTELEKYKKQEKKGSALKKLQKDYNALLREKEELEEAVGCLQSQLLAADGGGAHNKKQLKMLHEALRNLEEEVLQERNKHQRYVSKKTEELRSLTQELGELRSSERTLRSRVKNLTNELALLKKGLRSSPSGHLQPRHTPPSNSTGSVKKTSSSVSSGQLRQRRTSGSLERKTGSVERRRSSGSLERRRTRSGGSLEKTKQSSSRSVDRKRTRSNSLEGNRHSSGASLQRYRTRSGSLDRRNRTGPGSLNRNRTGTGSLARERRGRSHEKRLAVGMPASRLRTPSPRVRGVGSNQWLRFDPSAYVENKRIQRKESQERLQRVRSPSYHSAGSHSRSSSLEKQPRYLYRHNNHHRTDSDGSVGRPPLQPRAGSRRLWGGRSTGARGARGRSSSVGSLSGCSSQESSPVMSRGSYHRQSSLSDIEPSPPSSVRGTSRPTKRRSSTNKNTSSRWRQDSSERRHTSTPKSSSVKTSHKNKNNGVSLDHSSEMSEIDARLNALQQFMKRSLEATKSRK